MTAPKKKPLPTTRFRRNDQIVDVLEGAALLQHTGEFPAGVTQSDGGGLLFQGALITETSYLLYDELGTPLELWNGGDFKATYAAAFEGQKGTSELQGDLAQAQTMVKKLGDQTIEQDQTIDTLRKNGDRLKAIIEGIADALNLDLEDYATEEDFLAAVVATKTADQAIHVLRDVLRIEPAQVRDDGGRIIHLNKKIIDRAVAIV